MKRIKDLCVINRSMLDAKTNPNYMFKYIDIGSIKNNKYLSNKMSFSESPSRARKKAREGDVIISTVRTYLRAIASVEKDEMEQIASTGFCVITPQKINSDFLKYACMSENFINQIMMHSKGVSYPAISDSVVANGKIPDYSIKRQVYLANLLDDRVRVIDSVIESNKNKISLLEEYKTSLIHNAVTKGLDANGCRILDGTPASEMEWKDSGVEWIGKIPVSWNIAKLKSKYHISMGETILKEHLIDDGLIPVRSATRGDGFFGNVNKCSKPLKKGDIVVGARGTIGMPSLVSEISTSTQTTLQLRLISKMSPEFGLYWLIGNHDSIFEFDQTAIPQYTVDDMKNIPIALPQNSESNAISNYVVYKTSKIKFLNDMIKKKINLLSEYKKSLINEAVSGEIDTNGMKITN